MPKSPTSLCPSGFLPTILYTFLISLVGHMPCPYHPSWFRKSDNIYWKVPIMKLFIMQIPTSLPSLPLSSVQILFSVSHKTV
jgi:hypothetical protein